MTGRTPEQLAAAIAVLSSAVTNARAMLTERAIIALLVDATGGQLSKRSIQMVLTAIERMPQLHLTSHGRAIRVRETD